MKQLIVSVLILIVCAVTAEAGTTKAEKEALKLAMETYSSRFSVPWRHSKEAWERATEWMTSVSKYPMEVWTDSVLQSFRPEAPGDPGLYCTVDRSENVARVHFTADCGVNNPLGRGTGRRGTAMLVRYVQTGDPDCLGADSTWSRKASKKCLLECSQDGASCEVKSLTLAVVQEALRPETAPFKIRRPEEEESLLTQAPNENFIRAYEGTPRPGSEVAKVVQSGWWIALTGVDDFRVRLKQTKDVSSFFVFRYQFQHLEVLPGSHLFSAEYKHQKTFRKTEHHFDPLSGIATTKNYKKIMARSDEGTVEFTAEAGHAYSIVCHWKSDSDKPIEYRNAERFKVGSCEWMVDDYTAGLGLVPDRGELFKPPSWGKFPAPGLLLDVWTCKQYAPDTWTNARRWNRDIKDEWMARQKQAPGGTSSQAELVTSSIPSSTLQTADPLCPGNSANIYVDCDNGTVTDNRTGLVWLKNANCFGVQGWNQAGNLVAGLSDLPAGSASLVSNPNADCGLSDGSSPGEWRLPTTTEWNAMVADALGQGGDPDCIGTPPIITNDLGDGCWVTGPSSFTGVHSSLYWSSSYTRRQRPGGAFAAAWGAGVYLNPSKRSRKHGKGTFSHGFQSEGYVWPVRGGQ